MPFDTVGILEVVDFPLEQRNVIDAVQREVFVNEAPLLGRLPHKMATAEKFSIVGFNVRQRTAPGYAVATALTTGTTTLAVTDASAFMNGDVLELNDGQVIERVEVTGPPVLSTTPNTVPVRRAVAGTSVNAGTYALSSDGTHPTVVRLIGNTRSGDEIDQQGHRPIVTNLQQVVQTTQFPVQVGGKAEAISNVALPPGANTVMGRDRAIAAVEFTRDVEYQFYYGAIDVPTVHGDRGKAAGLKQLIGTYSSGANVRTGTAINSYTRQQFIADTFMKIYALGGDPDVIVCSTDFLTILDTWVPGKTAYMGSGKTNELGFPIDTFVLPLNGKPIAFVPSLQLAPGTAMVLSSFDLDVRVIREMFWQPRGIRGDAWLGDWIGDYCIRLGHPSWHAWVDGIVTAA